ncbi:MAG: hypothetical protein NWR72_14740 [Bacteroidia bacterium]|nr:hypothetical protein [Bacteroidia bacterium]
MKASLDLQKTIIHGLQGLPDSSLREIAEYIFFIRQKALSPDRFHQQLEEMMVAQGLLTLEMSEAAHLEEEFNGYQSLYPKE